MNIQDIHIVNGIVSHVSATQELSARTESLLREGERAHELGLELSRETDEIRRDLEGAVRACSGPDRSLCAVIDSSGIRLDLRIERVNKLYDWRSFGLIAFRSSLDEINDLIRGNIFITVFSVLFIKQWK